MMTDRINAFGLDIGDDEDVGDLLEAVKGLEGELALGNGELIRRLTSVLDRRRRFEALRRDHDVRFRRN